MILTACSDGAGQTDGDDSTGQPSTSDTAETATATTTDLPLAQGLDRIGVNSGEETIYVDFVHTSRLRVLADENAATWGLQSSGTGPLVRGRDFDQQLGIDLTKADYSISSGLPPSTITLVVGGQDGTAVRSAAEDTGYQGDDVLSQDLNLQNPMTVDVAQILPDGTDIALGNRAASMNSVDTTGEALLDAPGMSEVAGCLDDVVVATVVHTAGEQRLVAVGVQVLDGGATSVMCIMAQDEADAKSLEDSITGDLASGQVGRPGTGPGTTYAELFPGSAVTTMSNGVVKATMPNATTTNPSTINSMLTRRDLPGVDSY